MFYKYFYSQTIPSFSSSLNYKSILKVLQNTICYQSIVTNALVSKFLQKINWQLYHILGQNHFNLSVTHGIPKGLTCAFKGKTSILIISLFYRKCSLTSRFLFFPTISKTPTKEDISTIKASWRAINIVTFKQTVPFPLWIGFRKNVIS